MPIRITSTDRDQHTGQHHLFSDVARQAAGGMGSPLAFLIALSVVVVWALAGPLFHFSDTWQLIINTGTTVITFLMVFPIQNTQNRDSKAMQLKLHELIVAVATAHNQMLDIETLSDEELAALEKRYHQLRAECGQQNCDAESRSDADPRRVPQSSS